MASASWRHGASLACPNWGQIPIIIRRRVFLVLTVPGYPHHIIQRGNNRQAIFGGTADYELLLGLIDEHARKQHVAVHAYVLMSNHFHLLATPETEDGIPQMMQAVGRRYVRNYNLRHARTGTSGRAVTGPP